MKLKTTFCTNCLKNSCSSECVTCQQEPDCLPDFNCTLACGSDSACLDACSAKYPDAGMTSVNLLLCLESNCGICAIL